MKSLRLPLMVLALVLVVPATANAADPLISTNKPALASSNESTARNAAKAFDQNTTTRWASATSDPQWIRVDLGSVYRISRVKLNWETAYGKAYRIEVSDNGTTWTQIYSTLNGDGGIDDLTGLSGTGRYVRMYGTVRGTVWGYSLWEMEVYGAPPTSDPLVSTNKPATASSQEDTTTTPAKAFDQNTATRWSSLDTDPQWIYVDLGQPYNISRVRLNWEQAYGKSYRIETSNDATNWTSVYSTTTGDGGFDDITGLAASGRYVRMYGTVRANTTTGWGYSLYEIEVYGAVSGAPNVPDTSISSVVDHDSPTLIDEDGSGDEQVVTSFSGTNSPTSFTCAFTSDSWGGGPVSCTNPWTTSVPVGNITVSVTACNSSGCDPTPATNAFTMCPAGGCAPPPPQPQCSDGLDNDGDGLTDYPADPGCSSASDNDETNAGGGGLDPSGQAMPTGDLPGWHQIWSDNFPSNVALGSFPSASIAKWDCYPEPWDDTSNNGIYSCPRTASVNGGVLDLWLHTENGTHYVAAPQPRIFGPGQDAGRGQLYGRYAIRFRADEIPYYKTAWLLWPDSGVWPGDGEIDFPEGNLNGTIAGFMHHQNGSSGGDQDFGGSSARYNPWHTAVIEWSSGHCKFILDGTTIMDSFDRVPNTSMHWVIQTETWLEGSPPDNATNGHVQIDWATAYAPA